MRIVIILILLVAVAVVCCLQSSQARLPASGAANRIEPYIFVSGGVRFPGRYAWTNGLTVLGGIRLAGGFTDLAGSWVKVSHPDGASESFDRNVLEATNPPPLLRAGDQVAVPARIF